MFTKLQAKLRNRKGFTLVELLIVIAVLGIIAAIAVPRFTGVLTGVKSKADFRAAELLAKEIEAEFMVEEWAVGKSDADATDIAVAKVASKPTEGFDGDIPNATDGKPMVATISYTKATDTFTLTIKQKTTATIIYVDAKKISGPIN